MTTETRNDPKLLGTCDKCKQPAVASRVCPVPNCSATYHRCEKHGGMAGVMRSLHSHAALYHPRSGAR